MSTTRLAILARVCSSIAFLALGTGCSGEVSVAVSSGQSGSSAGAGDGGSCPLPAIVCGSQCIPSELWCANCLEYCPEQCSSRCGSLSLLATVPGAPPGPIALDDTLVYFGTGMNAAGSVMAVPKGGGDVVTVVAGQGFVVSIALDSQFVYWGENGPNGTLGGPLKIAPKTGGAGAVLVDSARGLAVDATSVYYWKSGGSLEKMPLGGGVPVVLATGASPTGIWDVAVQGDNLYWVDWDGTISSVSVDGGTPTSLVSVSPPASSSRVLAVDSASLYWLSNDVDSLQLWRANLDGSGSSVVFSGMNYPSLDLAVDTTGIYLSTFVGIDDGSSIEKVPLTGGSPTTLGSGPDMMPPSGAAGVVRGVALDANYVYWTSVQGYVGKTAK